MTNHPQSRHFNFPTKQAAAKARSHARRYGVTAPPVRNESVAEVKSVVVVGPTDALEGFTQFAFTLGGTSPTS